MGNEVETSTKTATFARKPRIEEGYYSGQLLEIKERVDKDGNKKEGKYGFQKILRFAIFDKAGKEKIMVDEEQLVLAKVMYYSYKPDLNKGQTEYKSSFTPNSAPTKLFKDLGWSGPDGNSFDMDNFVGKFCVINIDDWEAEIEEDGKLVKYKASGIKDTKPFEGEEPSSSPEEILEATKPKKIEIVNHTENTSVEIVEEFIGVDLGDGESETTIEEPVMKLLDEKKIADINKRMKSLEIAKQESLITPEGYENAMAALNEELGK